MEDYKGAIIEVSEEEAMSDFEAELKTDKIEMPNISRQLRESILPQGDFINFGRLANDISIDDIKDSFEQFIDLTYPNGNLVINVDNNLCGITYNIF